MILGFSEFLLCPLSQCRLRLEPDEKEVRQSKMQTIHGCPLCGGELETEALEGLGLDENMLQEVRILREQGKLTQAIFLAVKIVKTVQDNPQWMKDLLDEQTRLLSLGIKDSIHQGNSEILGALHELIGNPLRGKIQEVSIAKRLKAATPVDHLQQRILPERAKTSNALCSKQTVLQVRLLWNRRTLRPGPKVTLTKSRST